MLNEFILPLIAFAFVTSITPGPNNLMLMASGANFGFARTVPHMLGVSLGFVFMASLLGLGLAQAFETLPVLHTVLKVLSAIYMFWLAWKIANSRPPEESETEGKPLTFLQAAGFQWVNPKVWAMALTALTIYTPDDAFLSVILVAIVFGLINFPTVSAWVLLGQQMRRVLTNQRRLTVFNRTMAVLLIASLYPVLL